MSDLFSLWFLFGVADIDLLNTRALDTITKLKKRAKERTANSTKIPSSKRSSLGGEDGHDLISLFIEAAERQLKEKEGGEDSEEDDASKKGNTNASSTGDVLSDSYLRDVFINFLLAGRDTTSCGLSWLFYELSQNPEVEATLLKEIDEVVGGSNSITFEMTQKLIYLQACWYETLRLHPSVPGNSRICQEDDTLPDGTFIPKNTICVFSPYTWGRSEALWGADALVFNPQRWLTGSGQAGYGPGDEGEEGGDESGGGGKSGVLQHSMYKYISFYCGPRLCLVRLVFFVFFFRFSF